MSATRDLETLREAHRQAAHEETRLEGEQRASRRVPDRARQELAAYHEEVPAGEREPDADEERRLRDAVREGDERFEVRPVHAQGRVVGFENVDPALEGALAGAKRARDKAAAEVRAFARQHLDDLAAERLRESEQVARRAHEALQAAEAAALAWQSESAEWSLLLRDAGSEDLLDELPDSPFRGLPRPGTAPPSPAPAALVEEREAAAGATDR